MPSDNTVAHASRGRGDSVGESVSEGGGEEGSLGPEIGPRALRRPRGSLPSAGRRPLASAAMVTIQSRKSSIPDRAAVTRSVVPRCPGAPDTREHGQRG